MSNKKTQHDYWNEGVKHAKEKNWKLAIENYEKAVKLQENPALYTNLASCYKNLNNLEKEKENYLLAVTGLINKSYTQTCGPANSTAWYLFENDIELEKAEEIAKSATEIDRNSPESLDTYVNILLKLEKTEKAIENLAKLNYYFPEFEASKHLFDKYKSEIESYMNEYWKKESKEEKARKILENNNYMKNEIDFILYGGTYKKSSNFYPYNIGIIYKALKGDFIRDNDDIMNRFFKLIFSGKENYYNGELLNAITNYKSDKEYYNKAFNILKNAEIDIMSILTTMINLRYTDRKEGELHLLSLLDENFKTPKDYNKILTEIEKNSKNNYNNIANFLIKFLLNKSYDKYIDEVIEIMGETNYYYKISDFIVFIKEDDKTIAFIINKLMNFNNAKNKFKDEFFDKVKEFLEIGKVSNDFIKICETIDETYHYSNIYSYFAETLKKDNKFYDKLLKLSFLIDSKATFNSLNGYGDSKFDKNRMNNLIEIGLNLDKQFDLYLDKYSDTYSYNKKLWKTYLKQIIKNDFENTTNRLDEIAKDKKKLSFLIPIIWEIDKDKFYPHLLELSTLNSKQVKEAVINCLNGYKGGFEDFKNMLKSKKQAERIIGVELLASLDIPEKTVSLLNELLLKEKAQKVKDAINNYFSKIEENKAENRKNAVLAFGIEDFNKEAEQNKDLNLESIKKYTWINLEKLPQLYLKDNTELSQNLLYSLLNSLTKTVDTNLYYEAKKLLKFIRKDELSKFSKTLYSFWDKSSYHPFIILLLSDYYKKNDIINELYILLEQNISKNNEILVNSLTKSILLIGKKEGLKKIGKLLSKKMNYSVSNIFYDIGSKLKFDKLFLNDLKLTSFGFDENGNKKIDYGTRNFTLTMTPDFKFTVIADNGKSYKNLPKPSKKDDQIIANQAYEDFKNMKKELKDFVKSQKNRLEKEMIDDIKREASDWKFLFLNNPIMNNLAKGLIWNANGKTFRIMEDNTYADIEDEEYKLPDNVNISLAHPIDLSKKDIDLWKEQLEDYEITQPFSQIERVVYSPSDKDLNLTYISDFTGHMVMRISFKSKMMDKYGWNRGPAEDGGCYYSYNKMLTDSIKAEMLFMGECYGGYSDRFQEIWIGELYFYGENNKEIELKKIPKRLLSEVYLEVKSLADSGSGYNKDYLDTNW